MALVVLLLVAVFAFGAFLFNRLVGLKNRAASAWSDIDVQLKRRHDLVDNLVETVRGYTQHERQTLEEVTRLRSQADQTRSTGLPAATGAAEAALTSRLTSLLAVVEAYPELKASARFLDLQRALTAVENDIQNARRYYNAVVRDLNTRIQSFPDLLIAGPLGFQQREFFQLDDPTEAAVPQVNLEPRS
jgi:LemA protein